MSSNPETDPVQHGDEVNCGQEMEAEFVIAGGDGSEPLHPLEEILHAVTKAVSTPVEGYLTASRRPRGDARPSPSAREMTAQFVTVVTLVSNHSLPHRGSHGLGNLEVRTRPRIKPHLQRPTSTINQRGKLGVEATLGTTHGLRTLASRGIGSILVQFNVRGIQVSEFSLRAGLQPAQHGVPNAEAIPPTPPGVNALPRAEDLRQVSPGTAGASPEDHRLDHVAMTARRTATRRYRYRPGMTFPNFFNRSQSESRRKNRGVEVMIVTGHSDSPEHRFVHSKGV